MVTADNRVLVVDDEQIIRESYQRALADVGYAVRAVGNGRDALRACRAEPFDVMLVDLRMPDIDGLEVARAVTSEFPHIRVVIITGYPSQTSADQAAKLGIFDYLEKPLTPDRLRSATARAAAQPPHVPTHRGVEKTGRAPDPADEEARATDQTRDLAPVFPPRRAAACPSTTSHPDTTENAGVVSHGAEPSPSGTIAKTEESMLRGVGLLAAAPLLGLAFVLFLPLIGFGMLLSVLGAGLADRLGWTGK